MITRSRRGKLEDLLDGKPGKFNEQELPVQRPAVRLPLEETPGGPGGNRGAQPCDEQLCSQLCGTSLPTSLSALQLHPSAISQRRSVILQWSDSSSDNLSDIETNIDPFLCYRELLVSPPSTNIQFYISCGFSLLTQ